MPNKATTLCNWQPTRIYKCKPTPCPPPPIGCNKDVAEIWFTITDQTLLSNYNLAFCTLYSIPQIYIGIQILLGQNVKLGPYYSKITQTSVVYRYRYYNKTSGAEILGNGNIIIDKCYIEIPMNKIG
jgi:hypothetical protein